MLLEFDRLVPPSLFIQAPSWVWIFAWKKHRTIEGLGMTVAGVRLRLPRCGMPKAYTSRCLMRRSHLAQAMHSSGADR